MRKVGMLAAALVLAIGMSWAQGSRPVTKEANGARLLGSSASATQLQIGTVGTTAVEESRRGRRWIKAQRRPGAVNQRISPRVEFIDEMGKVGGEITQGTRLDGRYVEFLYPAMNGEYVASVERARDKDVANSGPDNPIWIVRFLDASGMEKWRSFLCCDSGGGLPNRVILSEDGSVAALLDAGEGQLCYAGEGGYPAPPGCVGLRIMGAEGKEIYRATRANEVEMSPHGKFALVRAQGLPTYLVNLQSGRQHDLPRPPEGGVPWSVEDSGIVHYYRGMGWPPGVKGYHFIPGKGLEKVKD